MHHRQPGNWIMLQSATLQKHLNRSKKSSRIVTKSQTQGKKRTDFITLHKISHADSEGKESPSSPANITVTARGVESSRNTSRDIYRPTNTWPMTLLVEQSGDEWQKKFRKSRAQRLEMSLERWTSPGIDDLRLVRGLEIKLRFNVRLPLSSITFPGNFKCLLLLQC